MELFGLLVRLVNVVAEGRVEILRTHGRTTPSVLVLWVKALVGTGSRRSVGFCAFYCHNKRIGSYFIKWLWCLEMGKHCKQYPATTKTVCAQYSELTNSTGINMAFLMWAGEISSCCLDFCYKIFNRFTSTCFSLICTYIHKTFKLNSTYLLSLSLSRL